jgi:hypothetical protein
MATVFPIVEGHGDELAVPVLLRRISFEVLNVHTFDCLRPFRLPRTRLLVENELQRALELGARKLRHSKPPHLRLVLMDADKDCPVVLVEKLTRMHKEQLSAVPTAIVFAVREFEAWFLAAQMSENVHASLRPVVSVVAEPEVISNAKGYFELNVMRPGATYSETVDQPKFAATMPIAAARRHSRSFDKLVRELKTHFGAK